MLLTALIGIGGIGVVAASVVIEAIGNPWRSRRPCFAVLFAVAGIQLVAGPVTLGWHGYKYGYGGTRASGASVASPEAEKFAAPAAWCAEHGQDRRPKGGDEQGAPRTARIEAGPRHGGGRLPPGPPRCAVPHAPSQRLRRSIPPTSSRTRLVVPGHARRRRLEAPCPGSFRGRSSLAEHVPRIDGVIDELRCAGPPSIRRCTHLQECGPCGAAKPRGHALAASLWRIP